MGSRRRSRPRSSSGTGVVAATIAEAATPRVPLTRMFQAPHSPPTDSGHAEDLDPFALADERQEQGEGRNGSSMTRRLARKASGTRPTAATPASASGVQRRRPRRPRGGGHDGEDEQHGGGDLALGAGAGAAGCPRGGRAGGRGRRPRSAALGSARPVVAAAAHGPEDGEQRQPDAEGDRHADRARRGRCSSRSSSTPLTAYPASGHVRRAACCLVVGRRSPGRRRPCSSPSGALDANALTSMARPRATSSPPATNRRRFGGARRSARLPRRRRRGVGLEDQRAWRSAAP